MRLRNKTVRVTSLHISVTHTTTLSPSSLLSYSVSKGWKLHMFKCSAFVSCDDWSILFEWVKRGVYAINTTNMMKNKIKTANILIISHRFDVTDWKYFKISLCAASTFMTASSVFESILKNKCTYIKKK